MFFCVFLVPWLLLPSMDSRIHGFTHPSMLSNIRLSYSRVYYEYAIIRKLFTFRTVLESAFQDLFESWSRQRQHHNTLPTRSKLERDERARASKTAWATATENRHAERFAGRQQTNERINWRSYSTCLVYAFCDETLKWNI